MTDRQTPHKNTKEKKPRFNSLARFRIVTIFMLLLMILILFKLFYVMLVEGEQWRKIAARLNPPELVMVNPIRGSIYDDDNRLIAVTAPYYRLYFDFRAPSFTQIPKDSMNRMLDSLATLISNKYAESVHPVSKQDLLKQWKKGISKKSRYWPVYKYNVSYLELKEMRDCFPLAPHRRNTRSIPSPFSRIITQEEQSSRMNPFGSLAMRTIGRVYGDKTDGLSHARNGIELAYDSLLRGQTGQAIRTYTGGKRNINTVQEPVRGADVYSTINMDVQSVVENVLRQRLTDVDAGSGTCVLMEVETGKILAISNLGKTGPGKYAETLNYALQDMSEPGSTFKTASMMVALDDGVVHPDDIIDVGNGLWQVAGRTVRDHNAHRGGYGKITVAQTIHYSSNVGVAKIIQQHYAHKPDDYVQKIRKLGFGLDLKLEIEGYEKALIRKRSDNPNRWYGTTLPWMSYGYETQVPPIYTLAFYNAIANNGQYMRPYFVNKVVDAEGNTVIENKPTVLIEAICKPETLGIIRQMLYDVVWKGTGKPVQSEVVSISGKTGTAQLAGSGGAGYRGAGGTRYQVSFCGYFPSEKPKYSCIAVVREPNPSKEYPGGGNVTGPIVRDIAEHMVALERPMPLDSLGLKGAVPKLPKKVAHGNNDEIQQVFAAVKLPYAVNEKDQDKKWVAVTARDNRMELQALPLYNDKVIPNVVGMAPADAVYLLLRRGVKPRLIGHGNVISQQPSAGTPVKAGMQVILRLENVEEPKETNAKKS